MPSNEDMGIHGGVDYKMAVLAGICGVAIVCITVAASLPQILHYFF